MKKIAFFDIDGTLTSEIDGSIPQSAASADKSVKADFLKAWLHVLDTTSGI